MAKFKIAQNPTFKADVEIPRVGGEFIKVPFEFKYRDRKALAKLAGSGVIASSSFREIADAAAAMEDATGRSVDATIPPLR